MRTMLFSTHLIERRARAIIPSSWELESHVEQGIDALLEATSGFDAISHEDEIAVGDRCIVAKTHAINLAATEVAALCCADECRVERHRLERAIRVAAVENDVEVVTLGALTPGLVRNGLRALRDDRIAVTTGSAFTAYAAVRAALGDQIDSSSSHRFAVLGAFGGVGTPCWQLLTAAAVAGERVGGLTLLHRPGDDALKKTACRLKSIVTRWGTMETRLAPISQGFKRRAARTREPAAIIDCFMAAVDEVVGVQGWTEIAASDDSSALRAVDRILVATNEAGGVKMTVRPHTVLYDIGQPLSFDHDEMKRRGCQVHRAGLVRFPTPMEFSFTDVIGLPKGTSLGCYAEGALLAAFDAEAAPKRATADLVEIARLAEFAERAGVQPTLA